MYVPGLSPLSFLTDVLDTNQNLPFQRHFSQVLASIKKPLPSEYKRIILVKSADHERSIHKKNPMICARISLVVGQISRQATRWSSLNLALA